MAEGMDLVRCGQDNVFSNYPELCTFHLIEQFGIEYAFSHEMTQANSIARILKVMGKPGHLTRLFAASGALFAVLIGGMIPTCVSLTESSEPNAPVEKQEEKAESEPAVSDDFEDRRLTYGSLKRVFPSASPGADSLRGVRSHRAPARVPIGHLSLIHI